MQRENNPQFATMNAETQVPNDWFRCCERDNDGIDLANIHRTNIFFTQCLLGKGQTFTRK
jgi:hypothetical protein